METVSGMCVFADAPSAAETARFTLLFTPRDHGAGWRARARNLRANGVAAKSCTAFLASSAVMPPTFTVWIVTPGWIVAGGRAQPGGPGDHTTQKTGGGG